MFMNIPVGWASLHSVETGKVGEGLTFAQMCIDAHVAGCASQAFVFPVRDVFFGLWVNVLFGKPKVNNVDGVLPLAAGPAHQEVLRLYVPIYQAPSVNILHPCYLRSRKIEAHFKPFHNNVFQIIKLVKYLDKTSLAVLAV